MNKLWTIKAALENENVCEVRELQATVGKRAQLMLLDENSKFIGFTRFYDVDKLRKKVSRWLFKDFPKEV